MKGRFDAGQELDRHEQGKHNGDHRDQAHQLPGVELTGSACMVVSVVNTAWLQYSAYSNFHSVANVCFEY